MAREVGLLRPALVVPVGKLAIDLVLGRSAGGLEDAVGVLRRAVLHGHPADVVALPHPSGLSSWWKVEPGRTLLARALEILGEHHTWRRTFPP